MIIILSIIFICKFSFLFHPLLIVKHQLILMGKGSCCYIFSVSVINNSVNFNAFIDESDIPQEKEAAKWGMS